MTVRETVPTASDRHVVEVRGPFIDGLVDVVHCAGPSEIKVADL